MQKFIIVFSLTSLVLCLQPLCGQEAAQKESKTEVKSDEDKPNSNLELQIEMTETIMSKMFQKAELSDEQIKKVDAILKENIKVLVHKRQEFQDFLNTEERNTFNAALKMARKAKYDTEQAEAFALKKLKFTEEKLLSYKALKDKVEMISNNINDSVKALLTDEQIEKLPMLNSDVKNDAQASGSAAKGSAAKPEGVGGKK